MAPGLPIVRNLRQLIVPDAASNHCNSEFTQLNDVDESLDDGMGRVPKGLLPLPEDLYVRSLSVLKGHPRSILKADVQDLLSKWNCTTNNKIDPRLILNPPIKVTNDQSKPYH